MEKIKKEKKNTPNEFSTSIPEIDSLSYNSKGPTITLGELFDVAENYPGKIELGFSDGRGFDSMIKLDLIIFDNGALYLTGVSSYDNTSKLLKNFKFSPLGSVYNSKTHKSDTEKLSSLNLPRDTPVYLATRNLGEGGTSRVFSKRGLHKISNIQTVGPLVFVSYDAKKKSKSVGVIQKGYLSIFSYID